MLHFKKGTNTNKQLWVNNASSILITWSRNSVHVVDPIASLVWPLDLSYLRSLCPKPTLSRRQPGPPMANCRRVKKLSSGLFERSGVGFGCEADALQDRKERRPKQPKKKNRFWTTQSMLDKRWQTLTKHPRRRHHFSHVGANLYAPDVKRKAKIRGGRTENIEFYSLRAKEI